MPDDVTALDALPLQHGYAALPEVFFRRVAPTPVAAPAWLAFNVPLARELGLDALEGDAGALQAFAGNAVPAQAQPLAMAYAGHQFGHFVPQLGDGRAILLGEVIDRAGQRRDLQLKGAGPTPFSRNGDGRAAIGPVLREFLVSEAMHALGVPTTRALAAVATGQPVFRDGPVPGAVLVRVAASHVRVGTFQYFAARQDTASVRALAHFAIERHYPQLAEVAQPHLALLQAVAARQASLVAQWMQVGFIHGVMNTDNAAISGETIDYGPCAFLDEYHPDKAFSSIDRNGRYAFGNQAKMARWNLARLAETLLPVIDPDPATALALASEVIDAFPQQFQREWLPGMCAKLGLGAVQAGDEALVQRFLDALQASAADYTLAFAALADASVGEAAAAGLPDSPAMAAW
ncbi:MAG: YdiU family protein, partial [Arenimonas sp.]|nr:YdiU family protein [Arenimonas sp.]